MFYLCYYNDTTNVSRIVKDPRFNDDRIPKDEFRDGIQDDLFFGVEDQTDLKFHGCMWEDSRFPESKACLATKEHECVEIRGVTIEQATILFSIMLGLKEAAKE